MGQSQENQVMDGNDGPDLFLWKIIGNFVGESMVYVDVIFWQLAGEIKGSPVRSENAV
jgi:hypothetical protein